MQILFICIAASQSCPIDSTYSEQLNMCVCINNDYILHNNQCIRCPDQSYVSSNQQTCICLNQLKKFSINTQQCTCQEDSYPYDDICIQCVGLVSPELNTSKTGCKECLNGYDYLQRRCCGDNEYLHLQQCKSCPNNTILNSNHTGCVCPDNMTYNADLLTCNCLNSKQYFFNGVCQYCPQSTTFDSDQNTCTCENNKIFDKELLICQCSQNSININEKCYVCPYNTNEQHDKCTCPAQMSFNIDLWDCVCEQINTVKHNDQCVKCKAPATQTGNRCSCSNNQYYDYNTQDCKCQKGLFYNTILNQCQQCPDGSIVNIDQKSCICTNLNQVFSQNTCMCNDQSVLINQVCQLCPQNSLKQNNQCVCQISSQIYDSGSNECKCQNNYYLLNNNCAQCPENSISNEKKTTCICSNNQYFIINTNQCATCPEYAQYNVLQKQCECPEKMQLFNNKCICKQVTYFFAGDCVKICPINSQIVDNKCVCIKNFKLSNQGCYQYTDKTYHTIIKMRSIQLPQSSPTLRKKVICYYQTYANQHQYLFNQLDFTMCQQNALTSVFIYASNTDKQYLNNQVFNNSIVLNNESTYLGLIGGYTPDLLIQDCILQIEIEAQTVYQFSTITVQTKNIQFLNNKVEVQIINITQYFYGLFKYNQNKLIVHDLEVNYTINTQYEFSGISQQTGLNTLVQNSKLRQSVHISNGNTSAMFINVENDVKIHKVSINSSVNQSSGRLGSIFVYAGSVNRSQLVISYLFIKQFDLVTKQSNQAGALGTFIYTCDVTVENSIIKGDIKNNYRFVCEKKHYQTLLRVSNSSYCFQTSNNWDINNMKNIEGYLQNCQLQ